MRSIRFDQSYGVNYSADRNKYFSIEYIAMVAEKKYSISGVC